MRHLEPSPLKPTLNIEALVSLAAVQNRLITPDILGHKVQRLNDPQAQLLALLVLSHSNVLDVPHKPEIMNELALDDERARADDAGGRIEDAKQVVRIGARRHPCVTLIPLLSTLVCEGFESS